ncbi:hypothetical protein BpHYR1_027958 [Brachionus plicatilis]|uniref:Uncharacterized protein n=1 Tax=Brachionus plicatilis TaxID=10195 RepID=A0A3M7Q3Y8_BRAPC|nr:hypothetical protein BpHYR1_027958 [Brachionus plicatilis]
MRTNCFELILRKKLLITFLRNPVYRYYSQIISLGFSSTKLFDSNKSNMQLGVHDHDHMIET